jgi:hypothetical protein
MDDKNYTSSYIPLSLSHHALGRGTWQRGWGGGRELIPKAWICKHVQYKDAGSSTPRKKNKREARMIRYSLFHYDLPQHVTPSFDWVCNFMNGILSQGLFTIAYIYKC